MAKYDLNNIYEWPITTRFLLIVLLCAIVFYFGYQWDIAGIKQQIANNKTQQEDLKLQLESVVHKSIGMNKEASVYPILQNNLQEWQKKLISYSELPNLLNDILKIGANNQLRFSLFNPGDPQKADKYIKVPVKIIAVGNYNQIANFISQVSNMQWIIVVDNFVISKEAKNDVLGSKLAAIVSTSDLLILELTLDIYHLEEGAEHA